MTSPATTDEERSCPDCGADVGEQHDDGCDVARCLYTGGQRLSCYQSTHDDCGDDIWTGEWPGVVECKRFGFTYGAGHADLNRLHRECRWDRDTKTWVKRGN